MNGLNYIRTRCNISENELALQLRVTKQAISAWENGRKQIPPERIKELSAFFGLPGTFFGEISEEDTKTLRDMAMYRNEGEDGKEYYTYNQKEGKDLYYWGEMTQSLDESYLCAKNRKKALLDEIGTLIEGPFCSHLSDRIRYINKGILLFERLLGPIREQSKQPNRQKVPYRYEILDVLWALDIALGGAKPEDIPCEGVTLPFGPDREYIEQLARLIREHKEESIRKNEGMCKKGRKRAGKVKEKGAVKYFAQIRFFPLTALAS